MWYNVLPMTTQTKRTHVVRLRITEEELKFLREQAEREDRTISSVLRLALRDYADKVA